MKGILCLSGGKDSVYAGYLALQMGMEIERALVFLPEITDSFMFHCPNIGLAKMVAECMGLDCKRIQVSGDETVAIEKAFSEVDEEYIVTGAIASEYQKERFERCAYKTGKKCLSPLWRKKEIQLLHEIIAAGMKVIFVGYFAEGFSEEILGKFLDPQTMAKLETLHSKFGINPSGEGGEYETLVLDAPFFCKRIELAGARKKAGINSGILEIIDAKIVAK
ncbi:MAG: diphthine--ammonia ligase [Thermoplasmata archaeon]